MVKSVIFLDNYDAHIKWRITELCNYNCSYCAHAPFVLSSSTKKEDWEKCLGAGPYVKKIIESLPGKSVKLDIIGGEVSLFPLVDLLQFFPPKLKSISITTNFSAPANYYITLNNKCTEKGILLEVTASFHTEFHPFEQYIQKIKLLKEKDIFIKGELVYRNKIKDIVTRYIKEMDSLEVPYIIERNKNNLMEDDFSYVSKNRRFVYKVQKEDGDVAFFHTRDMLIKEVGGDNRRWPALRTANKYCNKDYMYVYIEKNKVFSRGIDKNRGRKSCKVLTPIENYQLLRKPERCPQRMCSLCGQMSVSELEEDLLIKEK